MYTISQLINKKRRSIKNRRSSVKALQQSPQKLGICLKVSIMSPKKPNSAARKVAKVKIFSSQRTVLAYIPGQGHRLQQYSTVLVRGGRVKDLPGVQYHLIRGKKDFKRAESFERVHARSKYSAKKK